MHAVLNAQWISLKISQPSRWDCNDDGKILCNKEGKVQVKLNGLLVLLHNLFRVLVPTGKK